MSNLDSKFINYKNIDLLKRYISETGKIIPGRVSGVTSSQQRKITKAVKVADIWLYCHIQIHTTKYENYIAR